MRVVSSCIRLPVTDIQPTARGPGTVYDSVQVLVSQPGGGFLALFARTSVRTCIESVIHLVSRVDVGSLDPILRPTLARTSKSPWLCSFRSTNWCSS
jgi:hypothetical protein